MSDLVGNPADRFSRVAAQIISDLFCLAVKLRENVVNTTCFDWIFLFYRSEIHSTFQPCNNVPHYKAVFNITLPCHGSQIDYFALCV